MCNSSFLRLPAVLVGIVLMLTCYARAQESTLGTAAKRVILDTDPSFDPDDVGCMAMLHAMASQGECHILAVINSIHHQEGALSISAINRFYRRPAIPIGDYKAYQHVAAPADLYSHILAREYPRDLERYENANDSVALYREILASAEPRSVTVVVIGTMHNLSALLQSGPCPFSHLSGTDLIRKKVAEIVTMGGNFINGKGHDRTNWGGSDALCKYTSWSCLNKERNEMCRFVIENCESPFVASGWEVGCGDYHDAGRGNVMTGQALKRLDVNHIVRRSYEYHFSTRGGDDKIDRHSNDQCALLYAIRGEGDNFRAHLNGDIELTATGDCRWQATPNRGQGYIEKRRSKDLIAKEIEELMMGDRPDLDRTSPAPPTGVVEQRRDDRRWLTWTAADDPDSASWVVCYRVYAGETLLGTAYGTQFLVESSVPPTRALEVRSVNASGTESIAAGR